jgi:formyltetrahydrofolate hydrolase
MAKEANIASTISEEPPTSHVGSPYWNLLAVRCERADGTVSKITGAVLGNSPHIVKVDDYNDLFAFKPEGNYILSFRNEDRPGAISEVLDILHRSSINIASLNVARAVDVSHSSGEKKLALCFMALDDDISKNKLR